MGEALQTVASASCGAAAASSTRAAFCWVTWSMSTIAPILDADMHEPARHVARFLHAQHGGDGDCKQQCRDNGKSGAQADADLEVLQLGFLMSARHAAAVEVDTAGPLDARTDDP